MSSTHKIHIGITIWYFFRMISYLASRLAILCSWHLNTRFMTTKSFRLLPLSIIIIERFFCFNLVPFLNTFTALIIIFDGSCLSQLQRGSRSTPRYTHSRSLTLGAASIIYPAHPLHSASRWRCLFVNTFHPLSVPPKAAEQGVLRIVDFLVAVYTFRHEALPYLINVYAIKHPCTVRNWVRWYTTCPQLLSLHVLTPCIRPALSASFAPIPLAICPASVFVPPFSPPWSLVFF